ncbi:MAG: serine/threonine protein kinase [Deltaproteobacteria bacterium]|nr:serine/threonine protein kinase [Deltaproteobacteria bacterium]
MGPKATEEQPRPLLQCGRYVVFDEFAHGGFASVHVGRTVGAGGFSRTVAVKRLHRQYAKDPEVSAMFLDEAKVVARIRHPNVMPTLDLIAEDDELFLVMDYVEGVHLKYLLREARRRKRRIPLAVALRVMSETLGGLHAAHEAKSATGDPLMLVHRDVAPDNILVGTDGMVRLLDFGVARAMGQFHSTREGEVKGKLAYITPEQVRSDPLSRRTDIFSASVVMWEAMTGRRLFRAKTITATAHALLSQPIDPPSVVADTPKKLDGIVMQGLERDPERRWQTAAKMAAAVQAVGDLASQQAVARYVRQAGSTRLAERARHIAAVEAVPLDDVQPTEVRSSLESYAELEPPTKAVLDALPPLPEPKGARSKGGAKSPPNGDEATSEPGASETPPPQSKSTRPLAATIGALPRGRLLAVGGAVAVALLVVVLLVFTGGAESTRQGGSSSATTAPTPTATPAPSTAQTTGALTTTETPTETVTTSAAPTAEPSASASAAPTTTRPPHTKTGTGWRPPRTTKTGLYGRE